MFDGLASLSRWHEAPLVRRLADALFRRAARRRLGRFDSASVDRVQQQILQGLVQRGRATLFGRNHDFARIRTVADFRRLVPLRTPADLWRQYGPAALPSLDSATWPGPAYYLATCDAPAGQAAPPLVVSADLVRSHREAFLTALALVNQARPQARLLSGTLLLVGGGAALTPLGGGAAGKLEEMILARLPFLLRPCTLVAPYSGEGPLFSLAERAAAESVTGLFGNASRLVHLAACLRRTTGRDTLREVWPGLEAVLYSRGPADPSRERLAEVVGGGRTPVLLLEACVRPEGVIALEDPRQGRLRVLHDHGVFFEFVPLEDLGQAQPRRLGLGEVHPGQPYALALSSAAGLWACLIGLTVTFASITPPLLEGVVAGVPQLASREILPLRMDPPAQAGAVPPRHPQNAGTPAGPARKLARSPWSARADQR